MDLAAQEFLVSKSSVFLLDQSLGWGGVLFDIRRIEFTHNFVKFVHTDVIVALTLFEAASLIRLLQQDLLEFSINLLCLFFKLLVAPFVRGLLVKVSLGGDRSLHSKCAGFLQLQFAA